MKSVRIMVTVLLCVTFSIHAQESMQNDTALSLEERNKKIARDFYQDLWVTDHTENYDRYVADEYIVHDIFNRKGVTEPAIEQKKIADFFWRNGEMISELDYQIAEGDKVATRWTVEYVPETFKGKVMMGNKKIAIINVFRFEEGKIVEIWNHRHDIETGRTIFFTIKGLLIGLLIALVPTIIAIVQRRKIRRS